MPPERFGRYELQEPLGRGGMGEVHRAYDTVHDRTVAVKRLLPQYVTDEQFRARFFRECHGAAQLTEPHIIPIHDFGEIDERLYLDMRLVEGRDLGALLAARGPLPVGGAVDVVTQVAAALDAAHAINLVHRDVKPSNVLIDETGPSPHCYLVDFGVAGTVGGGTSGSLTRTGMIAGTLDYIAPERLDRRTIDHRADVYSLACLLYESLTGEPPFPCDEIAALCFAHLFREPPKASGSGRPVPPALDAVIAQGMAKDPQSRYTTAGELAAAAREVLSSGRPYPVPPPRTVPPLSRIVPAPMVRGGFPTATPAGPAPTPPPAAQPAPPLPPPGPPSPRSYNAGPPPSPPAAPAHTVGPPSRRPGGGRRLAVRLLVIGAVLAVVAAGALVLASRTHRASATTVQSLPADLVGDHPFTPPAVGKLPHGTASTAPNSTTVSATVATAPHTVPGNTPGLYGGSGSNTCDPDAMATFLEQHPDRAAAWAAAEGIPVSQVGPFIAGLTPVILRTNTAVTNNGFANGAATPFQSVLQAGTAVLVDARGVPRARCACGNPLAAPSAWTDPQYDGPTWQGLDPADVTVVDPAPVQVNVFVLVQVDTRTVVDRPSGTDGTHDQQADPATTAQALAFGTVTTTSGSTTASSSTSSGSPSDTSTTTSAPTSTGATTSASGAGAPAVLGTVPLPDKPSGVAVTPDGAHAYVTGSDGVSVIDTATRTVTTTIPATGPTAIALTPDGSHAYVTGRAGVSVIDTATDTVSTTIPATSPTAIALTPDGSHAYVTGSAGVIVIDTATDTVSTTIPATSPTAIAVSPDGGHAYVAGSDGISVIDTTTDTVTTTIPVDSPGGVAVTPDGSRVYVTDVAAGTVSVIDTGGNTVSGSIDVGTAPVAVALSPDGTRGYVVDRDSHDVSVVDTGTGSVVATVDTGGTPTAVAVSPDGHRGYVTDPGTGALDVLDTGS